MAKVMLICGKIASGKSYYAKKLREKENAVILSVDEITYTLYNNQPNDDFDEVAWKVRNFLLRKTTEFVHVNCNVILDWGFWQASYRKEISDYFKEKKITYEWHYIDVEEATWKKNIRERNARIDAGLGGSDFYVDQGLLDKLFSYWDEPEPSEMDIWYHLTRKE